MGNCEASFRRGSQNLPLPCISRLATKAFQCGTEPQPVQVCRFTPPRPNAGGISVAPDTLAPVILPSVACCALAALPSRSNSASNLPGPQLFNTLRTAAWLVFSRVANALRSGAMAIMAPTFKSRLGQPSSRWPTQPVPGFGWMTPAHRAGWELSTVEWHKAHWMPMDCSPPAELKTPVSPTTAFDFSRETVTAGSARLTFP